jgi:hypothetical protein
LNANIACASASIRFRYLNISVEQRLNITPGYVLGALLIFAHFGELSLPSNPSSSLFSKGFDDHLKQLH